MLRVVRAARRWQQRPPLPTKGTLIMSLLLFKQKYGEKYISVFFTKTKRTCHRVTFPLSVQFSFF